MTTSLSSAIDTLSTLSSTAYMYSALLPNGSQNLDQVVEKVEAVLSNALEAELTENSSEKIYQEGDEGYVAEADLDQDGQHSLSDLIEYYMEQNQGSAETLSKIASDMNLINNSGYAAALKAYAAASANIQNSLKSLISVYA